MLELAGRGHHVTEVTPFLESKIIPNYTLVEVMADHNTATGGKGKRKRPGNCKLVWKVKHFLNEWKILN